MKKKTRVKDKQLNIRLNESDIELIKIRAEKFGLSISKYLYGLVIIDATDDNMQKRIQDEGSIGFIKVLRKQD